MHAIDPLKNNDRPVKVDFILQGRCTNWDAVPQTEFDRTGMKVVEFKLDEEGGRTKLCWCRYPVSMIESGGTCNPIFHTHYLTGDAAAEAEARSKIRDEFDAYYRDPAKTIKEYAARQKARGF